LKVSLDGDAKKQYKRQNEPALSRISKAIEGLKEDPPKGDIKPLKGRTSKWQLRIGDYRILFTVFDNLVLVTHIERRGQAYSKKPGGNNDDDCF